MNCWKRYLNLIFVASLFSCALSEEKDDIPPSIESPQEKLEEKEDPNYFFGSAFEGWFQDSNRLIIIGHTNKSENKISRLFRLSENGIQDTTFNDTELYESSGSIVWHDLDVEENGRIIVKGRFTINGKEYFMAKLGKNGELDHQFMENLPEDFTRIPDRYNALNFIKRHQGFYYAVFNDRIIKIDDAGHLDSKFEFTLPINSRSGRLKTISMLPDGKILVMGQFEYQLGSTRYLDMMKLHNNGDVDDSFLFQYELEANSTELNADFKGSTYKLFPLHDGSYLLQGNFSKLIDIDSKKEYEHTNIVKLSSNLSIDENFSQFTIRGVLHYTLLPNNQLLFFLDKGNSRGALALVDANNGSLIREVSIGLDMIGRSDPVVHEGRVYVFSRFYDWLFFLPNYNESRPFLSFDIDQL